MKSIESTQVISADTSKVWNTLFNQYGDIHLHNPGVIRSYNMNDAVEGALGCVRHCDFQGGIFVEEEITAVNDKKNFTVTVVNSSYPPAVKEMYAIYEVAAIGENKTEVKMKLHVLAEPEMVADGILQQMNEPLGFYLLGLKHYIETGNAVTMENFPAILKATAEA